MFCGITQCLDDKHKWNYEHERLLQVELMMLLRNFPLLLILRQKQNGLSRLLISMKEALLVVDVQQSFHPSQQLIMEIEVVRDKFYSVSTVEWYNEEVTPFEKQLGWKPQGFNDDPLIKTDAMFVKYGYMPPYALIQHLKSRNVSKVYVCGIQTDACCLCVGFMLFDAGLQPTLLKWLTMGSSLDRSADLGSRLWRHHFGQHSVVDSLQDLLGGT